MEFSLTGFVLTLDRSKKSRSHTGVTVHVNTNGSSADESELSDAYNDYKSEKTTSQKTIISYRHVEPRSNRLDKASIEAQPTSTKRSTSNRDVSPREAIAECRTDISSRAQDIQSRAKSVQQEGSKIASAWVPPASVRPPPLETRISQDDVRRIARQEIKSHSSAERRVNEHPRAFTYGRFVPLDDNPYKSAPPPPPEQKFGPPMATQKTKVDVSGNSSLQERESSHPGSWRRQGSTSSEDATRSAPRRKPSQDSTAKSVAAFSFNSRSGKLEATSKASIDTTGQAKWEEEYDLFLEQYQPTLEDIGISASRTNPQSNFASRKEYRRRDSYDTDATVQPQSSVSQRPEMGVLMTSLERSSANLPKSQRSDNNSKSKWRSSDIEDVYGKQESAIRCTVEDDLPSHRTAPLSSPPSVPKPRVPSQQPPPPAVPKSAQNNRAGVAKSKPFKWSEKHDSVPPTRPSSPPLERRISEERRMYREQLSPYRDRLVQERLIRARPPPEDQPTSRNRRQQSPPRRDEPPRDDRGRAKIREKEGKPARRLRSILRSSSRSAWESDREGSRGRRVSFSNAIDVEVLSPPPSVSEVSKITSDMSRLDPSGRDRRRDDPRERYYYENTRRPDPQRSPRYGDDSDPDAEYRRRQMARALSESPSREKGLKMMRGESPEPRRRERPRKPSEYSPSPRTDTIKSANPRAKNRDSQAGASDPQSRYPPPSLRGNRTDDARSNRGPVMSGALPEDGRDGRRNTRDRDPRDEGRRGAKPDWEDRADSRRQHDQEDRRGSRQEARPDRPQEKSRPSDMAASSAAGTSASTRRQVIIDSNGQKRMANVVREGRDKDGRWIEVEEEVEYGSERRRRGN